MNKLSQSIAALLYTEPFYGHLISSMCIMKSTEKDNIGTAGVFVTDKINMIYNEAWFESLDLLDCVNVLKHECEHILKEHIVRAKHIGATDKERHKRFNIATDATINVKDLTSTVEKIGGVTVKSLNEMLKGVIDKFNSEAKKGTKKRKFTPMEPNQMAEYYYNRLNEFAENNGDLLPQSGMGETLDDHDAWGRSEGSEEMQKAVARKGVNDAVNKAGGIGSVSDSIAQLVQELNKSQVNWKSQLRQFFVNTIKTTRVSSRSKRNRRYGILMPGNKKKPEVHLALCVDTSGSVSDSEYSKFWSEMAAIHSHGVKITVIEADCEVKNVYEFNPKAEKRRTGYGGTAYGPPIEKAVELKVDGIIFFGDADCADVPKDPKKPFLWVIVRDSPAPAKFGKVIRLD
jgi:predicted metal-dependent peptidase